MTFWPIILENLKVAFNLFSYDWLPEFYGTSKSINLFNDNAEVFDGNTSIIGDTLFRILAVFMTVASAEPTKASSLSSSSGSTSTTGQRATIGQSVWNKPGINPAYTVTPSSRTILPTIPGRLPDGSIDLDYYRVKSNTIDTASKPDITVTTDHTNKSKPRTIVNIPPHLMTTTTIAIEGRGKVAVTTTPSDMPVPPSEHWKDYGRIAFTAAGVVGGVATDRGIISDFTAHKNQKLVAQPVVSDLANLKSSMASGRHAFAKAFINRPGTVLTSALTGAIIGYWGWDATQANIESMSKIRDSWKKP